jgi:hypothetical protein
LHRAGVLAFAVILAATWTQLVFPSAAYAGLGDRIAATATSQLNHHCDSSIRFAVRPQS